LTASTYPRDEPITEPTPTAAVLAWFDRCRAWLWLAIAVFYAIGFNGQWRIGPDSAIHVTLAQSLAQGTGFIHPTGLQDTVNPGLAYLTAGMFKLFGSDPFIAIDAVMLMCSAAVLVLTFWVVRLRFDRPTAVLIVCMLAANETFYRYGYQVLTDMPFLLGLMLMLLGHELLHRQGVRLWWGTALIALSVLVMAAFRSVVLTVLMAGALMVAYRMIRGSGWIRYAAVTTAAVAALISMRLMIGGGSLLRDESRVLGQVTESSLMDTLRRVFLENGPTLLNEHLPEAMFGVDFGSIVGLPLGVIAVIIGLALIRVRPLWGSLVVVFLAQWLVFVTTERYVLVLMPLLALSWWRIGLWAQSKAKPAVAKYVLVGLLAIWFAPNMVRVGAFIAEQRSQPFLAQYEDGRYAALELVADELAAIAEDGDVIIANHAPQLIYYTHQPIYGPSTLPTFGPPREDTVALMRSAGRILMVSPLDGMLNDRVGQLKLRQVQVLSIVPTPAYDRQVEHKIIQMRIRVADWENYNRRKIKSLQRGGAAEQRESKSNQQPGESEQPDDQTR
jgi:hypothetical protein